MKRLVALSVLLIAQSAFGAIRFGHATYSTCISPDNARTFGGAEPSYIYCSGYSPNPVVDWTVGSPSGRAVAWVNLPSQCIFGSRVISATTVCTEAPNLYCANRAEFGEISCVSACPEGTAATSFNNCIPTTDCLPPFTLEPNAQGSYTCTAPPCTAGAEVEGYAPTTNTQVYSHCEHEPKDGAQQETVPSGAHAGTHTTWVNTGVFDAGADTLIVPGSPEAPCEGLDCCLDMTEGQGYEGELAFLYCEEFWTEEDDATESYYNYGP